MKLSRAIDLYLDDMQAEGRRGHVRKLKNRWALTPRGVEFMRRTSAEKTALTQVGAAA